MKAHVLKLTGVASPPALWAAATQLGQVLPYPDCHGGLRVTAIVTIIAGAMSLLATAVGRRAWAGMEKERTEQFIFDISLLAGLVFSFALILQGAASVLLDPCAR